MRQNEFDDLSYPILKISTHGLWLGDSFGTLEVLGLNLGISGKHDSLRKHAPY